MPESSSPRVRHAHLIFSLTALLLVVADQLSKAWIRSQLALGESCCDVGFFHLVRAHNTGASFGIFPDHNAVLAAIASIGAVAVVVFALVVRRRFPVLDRRLVWVALGLILGGSVGNLIDRLVRGYVTDFLDFKVWPAFNLADSAVVVGVILFAYCLLRLTATEKPS
ncbi:MAG: signal peptidase II [Dehalococcoidales bacterium]|nr:signal peptidase II [Dehalococcoidales bacterium]